MAKKDILKAHKTLLEAYFDNIRSKYDKISSSRKSLIINKLEEILSIDFSRSEFDGKFARDLREKQDLTLRELGNRLNLSHQTIANYENGYGIPSTKKTSRGRRYLAWLKSEGYNPFNI